MEAIDVRPDSIRDEDGKKKKKTKAKKVMFKCEVNLTVGGHGLHPCKEQVRVCTVVN